MKSYELLAALEGADIDAPFDIDGFVSHDPPLPDGALYVHRQDDRWEVGVLEGGAENPLETFSTENEACNYAYDKLTRSRP